MVKGSRLFNFLQILLLLLTLGAIASAEEVITSYDVDIIIQPDGKLQITENISVIAENNKIQRGIYRDFPTTYKDRYGNRVKVLFEVQKVVVDGAPENYFFKTMSNGIRTYIGKKDVYVSRGPHEYTITYQTDRQLGFFKDHDELYFNAIPHGFDFPIHAGKVNVYLPENVPNDKLTLSGYTGPMGSKAQNYTVSRSGSVAYFELTKPLNAYEGFTIVVEFPKGVVAEPTATDRLLWFAKDNLGAIFGFLGALGILGYFLVIWDRVGRDPKAGTIVPQWEAPENYSPADVRYVLKRNCDSTVIAACVVEAAMKGWVEIIERKKGKALKKTYGEGTLSKEAQAFIYELFSGPSVVELDDAHHRVFRRAIDKTRKSLEDEHSKRSFVLNRKYLFYGVFMSLAVVVLMLVTTFITTGAPFSVAVGVLCAVLLIVPLSFKGVLEAPTVSGRNDLDKIAGLKMYLSTAERDTFREMGAPDDTLEVFEEFLPYAVALGVDYEWGTRFKSEIEKAIAAGKVSEHRGNLYRDSYEHRWFKGNGISSGLSSAIASSSSPPGSSSGGGGGGSSGGGGGGGGGGGW